MKTLQIGLEWFPERRGGLNRYYYDCTKHLPEVGIDFSGLVIGSDDVNRSSHGKVTGFITASVSMWQRWSKLRQYVTRYLKQNDYSLVVSHFAFYTFPALNLFGKLPMVAHFHGPWAMESEVEGANRVAVKFKKLLEQITYRRANESIVLSEKFRQVLHREYGVPLEKIHVIPGGVDVDRFNIDISPNDARTRLGWDATRPTIFCIRRLAKRMGLENLIAAMAEVKKAHPDVMLHIAGKGALADTLQKQIEELGLMDNVKLMGYVSDDDLPLCYRAADFSVVPTVALEGFGLITIESLAAGTPVLGTPVGGTPDIIRPFAEDLVFEGCEPEAIATKINTVLSGDIALPDSEACLQYVRDNYDWKIITKKIKQVYEKAANC